METPYYAHLDYDDKKDPEDGLPDENVTSLVEHPVYSINRPKPESLLVHLFLQMNIIKYYVEMVCGYRKLKCVEIQRLGSLM
jgi:hypothetical protein